MVLALVICQHIGYSFSVKPSDLSALVEESIFNAKLCKALALKDNLGFVVL